MVRAPFAGVVAELAEPLGDGEWFKAGEAVAYLVDLTAVRIDAYVEEADLGRLAPGARGTFIPADLSQAGIDVRVAAVDETAVRALPDRELASLHGGHIAVRQDENRQAVPEVPVYRVAIEALTHPQVRHTIVGTAVVEAKPVRLYRLIVNFALRIFYREGALG